MYKDDKILCVANHYEKKYFLNPEFDKLPPSIKEELREIAVRFTGIYGGLFVISFDEEKMLQVSIDFLEEDIMYDEISSRLKVKEVIREHEELFESLELFYQSFM